MRRFPPRLHIPRRLRCRSRRTCAQLAFQRVPRTARRSRRAADVASDSQYLSSHIRSSARRRLASCPDSRSLSARAFRFVMNKICIGGTQARRKVPGLWAATAGAPPVRQFVSRHRESEATARVPRHSGSRHCEESSAIGMRRRFSGVRQLNQASGFRRGVPAGPVRGFPSRRVSAAQAPSMFSWRRAATAAEGNPEPENRQGITRAFASAAGAPRNVSETRDTGSPRQ